MKVGDLVRMSAVSVWRGQTGIVTKAPMTERGRWAILLTSGQLIATMHGSALEVINGQES